jgi:hypothetical protein
VYLCYWRVAVVVQRNTMLSIEEGEALVRQIECFLPISSRCNAIYNSCNRLFLLTSKFRPLVSLHPNHSS